MGRIQICNCLEFNQDIFFHQQVGEKFTNDDSIVIYFDGKLLANIQTSFPQFVCKCILINFFYKANP